ncbi:hypothetical protein BC829DRAFT_388159 [Chytridium lagenaria]|nr:hypothetical protein BC829DRAFT_388159 [Chytridium lagenaria]
MVPNEVVEQIVQTISAGSQPEQVRLNHLSECARVSWVWYSVAMPLLWSLVSPVQANTVRVLVVNGVKDGKALNTTLSFNNRFSLVKEIDLSRIYVWNADIRPHIQPLLMNSLNLRKLNLSNCLWIKDDDLLTLINCTKLTSLILNGCGNVTGTHLGLLLSYLPNLTTFRLSGSDLLNDLTPVFKTCTSPLVTVELTNLWATADFSTGVAALLTQCHETLEHLTASSPHLSFPAFPSTLPQMHLKTLRLDQCESLDDESLIRLLPHISTLTSLNLCGDAHITSHVLPHVFEHTPLLTFLDTSYVEDFTDAVITSLAHSCPHLTTLHTRGCRKLTDASLITLSDTLPNLTSVCFDFNANISPAGVSRMVRQCEGLVKVGLSFCTKFLGTEVERLAKVVGAEEGMTEMGEGVMQFEGVRAVGLLRECL